MGYTRGMVHPEACIECQGDKKPFVQCIVIEGMFQGSCVGCHYNSQGVKCVDFEQVCMVEDLKYDC